MKYIEKLYDALNDISIIDECSNRLGFDDGINEILTMLSEIKNGKVIAIGNGGSAAIASHVVNDLCKNDKIKALCFSDYAYNTCISNDFGYQDIYVKSLEMFLEKEDILIAISSSGESQNIINAVEFARKKNCRIITLSGFKDNNKLRKLGDINIYVPKEHYGYVELSHQIILHMITDTIWEKYDE